MTSISNITPQLRRTWHPVGRLDEFTEVPTRIELIGEGYVIVRIDGRLEAFADVCPHRFARLSDGRLVDDLLECPYHGWRFDSEGRCAHVPALGAGATLPPARLIRPHLREQYGLLWLAPDDPVSDLIHIPEWDDPSLTKVWLPVVDINAGAAQAIDNFLDFSHFPFVHSGTFGTDDDRLVHEYSTQRTDDGWGFIVDYPHVIENHEDPKVASGEHPLVQPRVMRYEYRAPFAANLRLELPMTGMVNAIIMMCQPMTLERTRMYMLMLRNDCHTPEQIRDAIDYEMKVFDEDLRVIEFLRDKEVPLDRGQVHIRSDRHTVEYRRILNRLVET